MSRIGKTKTKSLIQKDCSQQNYYNNFLCCSRVKTFFSKLSIKLFLFCCIRHQFLEVNINAGRNVRYFSRGDLQDIYTEIKLFLQIAQPFVFLNSELFQLKIEFTNDLQIRVNIPQAYRTVQKKQDGCAFCTNVCMGAQINLQAGHLCIAQQCQECAPSSSFTALETTFYPLVALESTDFMKLIDRTGINFFFRIL